MVLFLNFWRKLKWKKKIDQLSKVTDWKVHDLRRTVTTELAGLKVLPHVVERILNHKDGEISGVAAIYNQYDYLDEKREALNLWAETVDEITN